MAALCYSNAHDQRAALAVVMAAGSPLARVAARSASACEGAALPPAGGRCWAQCRGAFVCCTSLLYAPDHRIAPVLARNLGRCMKARQTVPRERRSLRGHSAGIGAPSNRRWFCCWPSVSSLVVLWRLPLCLAGSHAARSLLRTSCTRRRASSRHMSRTPTTSTWASSTVIAATAHPGTSTSRPGSARQKQERPFLRTALAKPTMRARMASLVSRAPAGGIYQSNWRATTG